MSDAVQIISENIELSALQSRLNAPQNNDVFIDVRSPEEFHAGHIPGFINVPLDHIEDHLAQLEGKDVILSCKSGVRAKHVAEMLHSEGHIKSIIEFGGGFKEWQGSNLPIKSEVSSGQVTPTKDYHPELEEHHIHNGANMLSKVKKNITYATGTVSHQVFDQAKSTFGNFEKQFVALPPLRQVYAILGGLILLSAIISGVGGIILSLFIALALIFSAITGIMFMTDWVAKAPWNKKK